MHAEWVVYARYLLLAYERAILNLKKCRWTGCLRVNQKINILAYNNNYSMLIYSLIRIKFNWIIYSEYRVILDHWLETPLVRSRYPSTVNRINFTCYTKYCYQKMLDVLVYNNSTRRVFTGIHFFSLQLQRHRYCFAQSWCYMPRYLSSFSMFMFSHNLIIFKIVTEESS